MRSFSRDQTPLDLVPEVLPGEAAAKH
jgi:hypothetical protein